MNRYQSEPYSTFVQPHYASRDAAHNFRHVERILSRLGTLSEGMERAPRLDILYCLACFHGLRKRLNTDPAFQEEVKDFLRSLEWSETDIEEVARGLARHLSNPLSVEEKIVHDANYLEILGAFGIAKAFTTGGARGQLIEETADIFEKRFLDLVVFQTPVGKRLAGEGRDYARNFLKKLRSEC